MDKMRAFSACLLLAVLTACGGGSDAAGYGGNEPSPFVLVEGTWVGNYQVPGDPAVRIYAAILQDGYAFFFDTKGILYVMPTFHGKATIGGTLTSYAPMGMQFEDGSTKQTFQLSGTASDEAIHGSFTGNGITASFTLRHSTEPEVDLHGDTGIWQGYYVGSHAVAIAIDASFPGTGSDSNGCTILEEIEPHMEGKIETFLFDVAITSTGGPLCYGNLRGLAFASNTDLDGLFGHAPGIYYYVAASNSKGGFIAELKVQ